MWPGSTGEGGEGDEGDGGGEGGEGGEGISEGGEEEWVRGCADLIDRDTGFAEEIHEIHGAPLHL